MYAVRQARALVEMGHVVTVLTSQYESSLPTREQIEGVKIIRVPVAFRFSKGVIMPKMPLKAWRLMSQADVVNLHLPQGDAAMLAIMAKLQRKPVVVTYHCDLKLPAGWLNQMVGWIANVANRVIANLADAIVHNTEDFAEHSDFLRHYLDKLTVIQPPIFCVPVSSKEIHAFREKYDISPDKLIIGLVTRLAAEKGVEYLVKAMPKVLNSVPDAQVVFVGEYKNVIGENTYKNKILPMTDLLGEHWTFLGIVSEVEKSAFYQVCDVLVLPSINSTESFGMVQVEALICGTPVVATDLPGVRQPVLTSGMGVVVPTRDSSALSKAIIEILSRRFQVPPEIKSELIRHYSPEKVAEAYDDLFHKMIGEDEQP